MASCNVNDMVRFRLTEHGKEVLETHLSEEKRKFGFDAHSLYRSDCLGYIRIPLHDFMVVFGKYHTMGSQQIIEDNKLTFVGEP